MTMQRDQVIQWAREAGLTFRGSFEAMTAPEQHGFLCVESFAALVHDAAMEACMCAVAGAFSGVADYEALANACDAIRALKSEMGHLTAPVPTEAPTAQPSCQHEWQQVDRGPTWELVRCIHCGEEVRHFDD